MVHLETVYEVRSEPSIVHCSTILPIENGQLLCVWYQGSYETSSDTVLMGTRRDVDGRWSKATVLFDFKGAPLGNPVLWRSPAGDTIFITFSVLTAEDWKSSLLFYSESTDEGNTWSPAALFLSKPGYMSKTKPIATGDGGVLYPLYHEGEYCPYVMRIEDLAFPMGSSLVAETMARKKAIQPALFRIDQSKILMMCRTNQGSVWRSMSFNNGYSWSILRPTDIPNPDSGVDLFSLPGDQVGIVYNPSENERNRLAIASSGNHGQSWTHKIDLVTGEGEYSYPFAVKNIDGMLAISYTDSRYAIRMALVDALL